MSQFWMSIFGAKFKCINRAYEISVQNIGQSLKIQYSVSKNSWISIFFLISLILLTLKPIKINRKMNFDHSSLQTYPESTWVWGTFHILAQYLKFVENRPVYNSWMGNAFIECIHHSMNCIRECIHFWKWWMWMWMHSLFLVNGELIYTIHFQFILENTKWIF